MQIILSLSMPAALWRYFIGRSYLRTVMQCLYAIYNYPIALFYAAFYYHIGAYSLPDLDLLLCGH